MRIPRLRTHPGVNVALKGGSRTIIDLVDSRIAQANGPRLVQVTRGCDGLPTQHLLSDLQCATDSIASSTAGSGGSGVIRIATPTWNGATERMFTGNAGRSPVIGTYGAPAVTPALPARYLDNVGNLWDENGLWLSAGNTPAVIVNQYGVDGYPIEVEAGIRTWPSPGYQDVLYGDIFRRGTLVFVNTQISGLPTMISASTPYGGTTPLFDGAVDGVATSGPYSSGDYLFSVEFFVDSTIPYTGLQAGAYAAIRLKSTLLIQTSVAISGGTGTWQWSVGSAPNGTWIAHKIISGNSTCTLHRFGYVGTTALALETLNITNDGYSGKTAWAANTFIKQVQ